MLGLNPDLTADRKLEILCIGAHCDDIEIGCGATLLALQKNYPIQRIHWAIFCSTPQRRREAQRAMRAFVKVQYRGLLHVGEMRDGHLPSAVSQAKQFLEEVRKSTAPNLVFSMQEGDRHQDHRLVSEVTWQTFRDHTIWEYEIPKYDGGLTTPNFYVPIERRIASQKARAIVRLYGSQRDKHWFSAETFESLMRLRGIECKAEEGMAEAFFCRKLVLGWRSDRKNAIGKKIGKRTKSKQVNRRKASA